MASNGYATGPPEPATGPGRGKYSENGRLYQDWHKGQYLFPVDEAGLDLLDAAHKFFMVARLNALWSPHISLGRPGLKILDLGCGTGIWGLSVAKKLWDTPGRDADIKGVDLSIDTQTPLIFSNTKFYPMDIEETWIQDIGHNSQHLIHMRMLAGSIFDWKNLYSQIFRHLIPGVGFMEHVEIDWELRNDSDPAFVVSPLFKQWTAAFLDALEKKGRPTRVNAERTRDMLREIGFVDVKEEKIRVYVNGGSLDPYEIDVGRWFNLCLHKGFMALSLAPLCRAPNPSSTVEELKALEPQILREIGNRNNRSYVYLYVWTARRPE